jgi:predicted glycoside hydrolase/deacetylase ChbG (UPF0249 family)
MRGNGLLIVNADDWGHDEETTDAIAGCHEWGALTSTTAMMFMEGSEHAARRAAELPSLGVGLHLNLDEEYSDPAVPPKVRERQRRLVDHYRDARRRRWLYDPRHRQATNRIVADQFERFHELYGRAPTHLDGHHHAHLAANVLLSPAVPWGTKIRNTLTDTGHRSPLTRGLQMARDRLLLGRRRTTEFFFDLRAIWPDLGGAETGDALGLASESSVEIMVHPGLRDEFDALRSSEWAVALEGLPLGTFAAL